MIITLFFACILPGKELVGDSDRPFDPSISGFESSAPESAWADDSATAEDSDTGEDVHEAISSELFATVNGDDVQVQHYDVHLPCDFDSSEVSLQVDTDEFQVVVIYSEREPDGCYHNLSYSLDFENAPSGTYQLEAQGDETSFEF